MKPAFTPSVVIALAAVLSVAPRADAQDGGDTVTLRHKFTAGDRWAFEEDLTFKLAFKVLANGKVAQAVDQTSRKVRKGDLSVLEAAGERLDAVRARYGPECRDTEQTADTGPKEKATALAGQTVTVRRQAQGDAAVECAAPLSEDERKEARDLIEPAAGLFPKRPVKVGDRWVSDERAFARALDLGPDDRGTGRMTLKALRVVADRRTAEVEAVLVVERKQDFMRIAVDLEGTIRIDVETGVAVGVALHGPLAISGETEREDEEGRPAKIAVEGGGECKYLSAARRLPAETASPPEGAPESPPPPAVAGAERFGHTILTPPSGWKATAYSNGVVVQPTDLREGTHLQVIILQALEPSSSLDLAFERSWDDACEQLGCTKTHSGSGIPYTKQQAGTSFRGWEYARGDGYARSSDGDYYMNLLVAKLPHGFERVAVVSKKEVHRDTGCYQDSRYYDVIQEFLFSLQFDDWKEPPVAKGTLKGDGIIGVWQGISMMGGTFKACYAIFFSNGQAFFGSRFPLYGIDGLDPWIDAEMTPRYWGAFAFENGTGVLRMKYGDIPLRSDERALILTTSGTDHRFVKLPPVDGARFDGTWVLKGQYSDGRPDPSITFSPAGEFRDEGAVNVLNHGYPLEEEPGTGTYEVKGFTLTLRFSDGRRYRLAFPGIEYEMGNTRPPRLILSYNEDPLVRR